MENKPMAVAMTNAEHSQAPCDRTGGDTRES